MGLGWLVGNMWSQNDTTNEPIYYNNSEGDLQYIEDTSTDDNNWGNDNDSGWDSGDSGGDWGGGDGGGDSL